MKKIDDHMHICLNPQTAAPVNGVRPLGPEEMIPIMERYGTERSILMSSGEEGCIMDNQELREICRRYPDRFSYMAVFRLDNQDGLEERILQEIEAGAKGVGEFTIQLPFDHPLVWSFLEILQRYHLPLLFHMTPVLGKYYGIFDDGGLPRLEKTLRQFPELPIIAHSQPFWYEMDFHASYTMEERNQYPTGPILKEGRVAQLLRTYPNLYGDLSANSGGNAIMRDCAYGIRFLEEFQDRLLYGTDQYSLEQDFPLGSYLDQIYQKKLLSQSAYEKIIRKNSERLFRLDKNDQGDGMELSGKAV